MNILIVTSEIGTNGGGLSLSCSKLISILKESHTITICDSCFNPIITATGGYSEIIEDSVRKEFKLKQDTLTYKSVDVIIGFGGGFNGYYASLLAEQLNKSFILFLRGSDANIAKWSFVNLMYTKSAINKAEKIICLSKEISTNILNLLPDIKHKIIIIPNEIHKKNITFNFPNIPKKVIIGCAAYHLNEKKGIANILCMVAEFKKISAIKIEFVLIGQIDEDLLNNYKELIMKLNIKENVKFLGTKNRALLHKNMKTWDFYIQGSVCEGFPNSISESLENGTGFISSKTGFISEILSSKFPMFYFKSFNPTIMAQDLISLIKIKNKEQLYHNALLVLQNVCNKNKIKKQIKQLLHQEKKYYNCESVNIEHIIALGLHDINKNFNDCITVSENVFKEFVSFIHRKGYRLCSMKNYLSASKKEKKSLIVCTFDDGYDSLINIAMPILKRYNFTATVFICTQFIGNDNSWNNKDCVIRKHLNTNDLNKLIRNNWEIGSHGITHRNLCKLSTDEIIHELSKSKEFVKQMFGYCESYSYPYGDFTPYIQTLVKKYYNYAFSVNKGGSSIIIDNMQIRRYSINDIYTMLNN